VLLYFLYAVHVLICVFLILVVLLQQGSGADLSVFGGGATQTAFGARSATSLLHKLTVGAFVGFIVTTIGIGFVKMGGPGGSVMTDVPAAAAEEQAETPATPEETSDELPPFPDAGDDETELAPSGEEAATTEDGGTSADEGSPDQ
jgi:preprotein translocase subunit SecG